MAVITNISQTTGAKKPCSKKQAPKRNIFKMTAEAYFQVSSIS